MYGKKSGLLYTEAKGYCTPRHSLNISDDNRDSDYNGDIEPDVEPFSHPPPSHRPSAELYCLRSQLVFYSRIGRTGLNCDGFDRSIN